MIPHYFTTSLFWQRDLLWWKLYHALEGPIVTCLAPVYWTRFDKTLSQCPLSGVQVYVTALLRLWHALKQRRCWKSTGPLWVVISCKSCACHLWRSRPAYITPPVCLSDTHRLSHSCTVDQRVRGAALPASRSGTASAAHWHGHRRRALTIQEPCLLSSVAKGNFPLSVFYSDAHILRWEAAWTVENTELMERIKSFDSVSMYKAARMVHRLLGWVFKCCPCTRLVHV